MCLKKKYVKGFILHRSYSSYRNHYYDSSGCDKNFLVGLILKCEERLLKKSWKVEMFIFNSSLTLQIVLNGSKIM